MDDCVTHTCTQEAFVLRVLRTHVARLDSQSACSAGNIVLRDVLTMGQVGMTRLSSAASLL